MDITLIVAGVVALMVLILIPVFIKSRRVKAVKSGRGTLYDYQDGERLAAPFAEQIEDIVRKNLESDPLWKKHKIDFGSAPDGSLEIWVDEKMYPSVDQLPDENLKQVFRRAIKEWNSA